MDPEVLREIAREAAAAAGLDPDEVVQSLEAQTGFAADRLLQLARSQGLDADDEMDAVNALVTAMATGDTPGEPTPSETAPISDEEVAALSGPPRLGPPQGPPVPAAGPKREPEPVSAEETAALSGPPPLRPWEGKPTGTPRPLTPKERDQARKEAATLAAKDQKPHIRSLADIMKGTPEGEVTPYTRLSGQEIAEYLPLGVDDARAGSNLLRLMGYEPNRGNPSVGLLESLVPKLSEQSDLQRRLQGGLAIGQGLDTETEEQIAQRGEEARLQMLGDISGTMGSGATSMVTPQQGLTVLQRLRDVVRNPKKGDISQTSLQAQFGEQTSEAIKGTLQTILDQVGGGMSPMFRGNHNLQAATLRRLYEQYRNSGTADGQSFLEFLVNGMVGAGAGVA